MSWIPPSLPAGHEPTAAEIAQITTQVVALSVDWSDWTPTLANLTQGNGTIVARYQTIGQTTRFRFKFTLGSTSAVGTAPTFTLPFTPRSDLTQSPIGDVYLLHDGVTSYRGQCRISATVTTAEIIYYPAGAGAGNITATAPFTWDSSDVIHVVSYDIELA